jgi:hypothetical protein
LKEDARLRRGRVIGRYAISLTISSFLSALVPIACLGQGVAPSGTAPVTIDPVFFGAKGDGIANDTPAFTKALDYARTHGYACVTVRPGRYKLTTPILAEGGRLHHRAKWLEYEGIRRIGAGGRCDTNSETIGATDGP